MAGDTIAKMFVVYYNGIRDAKLLKNAREEAKKFGMSLSTFTRLLLRDSKLITGNKDSNFYQEYKQVKDAMRRKKKA